MPQTPVPLISRPQYQRRSEAAASPNNVIFWERPYGLILSYETCIRYLDAAMDAYMRALNSGVVEYHVGSRGLKRFTLKELEDAVNYWTQRAQDAELGGIGTAIQSRRAAPCDV